MVATAKHFVDSVSGIAFSIYRSIYVAFQIIAEIEGGLPNIHSHVVLGRAVLVVAAVNVGIPKVDEALVFILGRIADGDEHLTIDLGFDGTNTTLFISFSTESSAKEVAVQGAIKEADSRGIVAVRIDATKSRATIHVAVDERKSSPWVVRGIGCLRPDVDDNITGSIGGLTEATTKHFGDMSGIDTHLATKKVDARNTTNGGACNTISQFFCLGFISIHFIMSTRYTSIIN